MDLVHLRLHTWMIFVSDIHSNALDRKLMVGISKNTVNFDVFTSIWENERKLDKFAEKETFWQRERMRAQFRPNRDFSYTMRNKCRITYASIETKRKRTKTFPFLYCAGFDSGTVRFQSVFFALSISLSFYSLVFCLNKYFDVDFSTQNPVK